MKRIVQELEPPYYAAMFEAYNGNGNGTLDGRVRTAQEMIALASRIPGFLGIKTAEIERGRKVVVSYWKDMDSIFAWRDQGELATAQRGGLDPWDILEDLEVVRIRGNPLVQATKRVANAVVNDGWGQAGLLIIAAAGLAYRTL